MNIFAAFLYRLSGAVPKILSECPASERQRYRNMGYAMGIVGVVTAFSAHHAALLCGSQDPIAWVPAMLWALFMIACDRICVMALAHRDDRATPRLPIVIRTLLVLVNAVILGFFALLAYNQEGSARIRFEQKQQAIGHDQVFFEGHYQTGNRTAEVAESANAIKDVNAKLALVPAPIAELRGEANACDRNLAALQADNNVKRVTLREKMADLQSSLTSLGLGVERDIAAATTLQAAEERIRARLALLDRQEALKHRDCMDVAEQAALASREYYGPLHDEKTRQQELLLARQHALTEARAKFDSSMAESEQVSAAAYGFNLSGETGALWELLTHSAFAQAIALLIWLVSVCLETLPILQKVRARGGPYDQRVAAEEKAFEATIRHRFDLEILESAAAAEKMEALMPEVVEMSKPLTMFVLSEGEIAKARIVRERSVKADPSRMQAIEDAFQSAVAKARMRLHAFLARPTPEQDVPGRPAADARRAGRSWIGR